MCLRSESLCVQDSMSARASARDGRAVIAVRAWGGGNRTGRPRRGRPVHETAGKLTVSPFWRPAGATARTTALSARPHRLAEFLFLVGDELLRLILLVGGDEREDDRDVRLARRRERSHRLAEPAEPFATLLAARAAARD